MLRQRFIRSSPGLAATYSGTSGEFEASSCTGEARANTSDADERRIEKQLEVAKEELQVLRRRVRQLSAQHPCTTGRLLPSSATLSKKGQQPWR